MGTTFSTNETVSHSPNRPRVPHASNRQSNQYRSNQRINSNLSQSIRRSSANIPPNLRNRFHNECENSFEVQIHRSPYGQSINSRQLLTEHDRVTSGHVSNNNRSNRPHSFGGDLTFMGLGSESDTENDLNGIRARLSLMPYFLAQDKKCSICKKIVPYDNFETHYVMCFTKPRVTFNDDILTEDQGECVICLVELVRGDAIARLPCLCIYHKSCIEQWFQRSQTCPSHPEFSDSSGR